MRLGAWPVLLWAAVARVTSAGGREVLSDCGGGVHVLRAAAWPGAGVELVLGLTGNQTLPAQVPSLSVNGRPAHVTLAPQLQGITGFLLVQSGNITALRVALQAAVERLPLAESVVVWTTLADADARPELVADVTISKQHVISRLMQMQPPKVKAAASPGVPQPLGKVLHELQQIDPHGDAVSRNLVVVAERPFATGLKAPSGAVDASPVAVSSLLWLTARDDPATISNNGASWRDDTRGDAVLRAGEAVADIIAARRGAVFRAGVCLPENSSNAPLLLKLASTQPQAGATCRVSAPSRRDATESWSCDAESIALGDFPFPDSVTVVLSNDGEEAVFDSNAAFVNGTDAQAAVAKGEMNASLVLGSGIAHPATLHFHGFSSFRTCARKSMAVHLHAEHNIRLQPHSTGNRFLLISMCLDNRYVKTQLVETLYSTIGVYGFRQRYVSVAVRHANSSVQQMGLYLMVEDSEVALSKDATQLAAVVRRRQDPDRDTDPAKGTPDVKVFDKDLKDADVLADYDDLAATGAQCSPDGGACYAALAVKMDIDQFLRLLAAHTLVGNADFTDELFFYTSRELNGKMYWRVNAWDTDDAFEFDASQPGNGCHHDGKDAQWDPHGMLFCSEGSLDKVLMRAPDMYARWADELQFLAAGGAGLSRQVFEDTALRQLASIYGLVRDDNAVVAGLLELREQNPNITDAAAARADISDALGYYLDWAEVRRAQLLHQLRVYRTRVHRPAAPVPIINARGDFIPGALLSAVPPPPPAPVAPPLRALNEAPPGALLVSACNALQTGRLQVSLATRMFNYTSPLPQELALVPRVVVAPDAGGAGVALAGLTLGWTFDRVPLDQDSDGEPVAVPAAPSEFVTACYSGGAVPERAHAVAEHDMCAQYGVSVTIAADRIAVALSRGTLCAGCVLDLGVDAALASVWHRRWLPLPNATQVQALPVTAVCGGQTITAPAQAPML
jgi:hypothetical protein